MQPLIWEHRPDGLRAPALVCAFTGWNDAGDAASSALSFLGQLAGRDALRADRPRGVLRLPDACARRSGSIDGGAREIVWPAVEVFVARVPRAPRDLVLLGGPEPSMRWRTFTAVDHRPRRGARRAARRARSARCSPTSRTACRCRSAASTSDPLLDERLGLRPTGYEGPTGIVGVLARGVRRARHPVGEPVGERPPLRRRRAQPEGRARAAAQARGPRRRRRRRHASSRRAAADYERQVGLAVQSDPDVQAFVERLEQIAAGRARRGARRTSPRATASRASSSASCASAATSTT